MGIDKTIKKFCVQDAVYWGNPKPDGHGGMTYDAPRAIKCRWDESSTVISDAEGVEFRPKVTVLVTEELTLRGVLALGDISQIPSDTLPSEVEGAYEIRTKDRIPMVRSSTIFVNIVYLSNATR